MNNTSIIKTELTLEDIVVQEHWELCETTKGKKRTLMLKEEFLAIKDKPIKKMTLEEVSHVAALFCDNYTFVKGSDIDRLLTSLIQIQQLLNNIYNEPKK